MLLELLTSLLLAGMMPLVAFFWGACPCCPSVNCGSGCSSTPNSISLTVTGFTNNNCSTCDDYNATYVCARDPIFPGACRYTLSQTLSCDTVSDANTVLIVVSASGGQTTISANLLIDGGQAGSVEVGWGNTAVGASRQDCLNLGTVAVTFSTSSASPTPQCDHDSSDATVTFA